MFKQVIAGLSAAAALAAFTLSAPALATPISTTINMSQVFTGATPDGDAPWLVATFSGETGSSTGTLTLTSRLGGSDFVQGLNSANSTVGWAFYLDQSLASVHCSSGTCADSTLFGGSYNSGPVPGTFNLAFGWDQDNRFGGTDSAVYNLTFASALTGNPFVANGSGYESVAHVQGIGTGGDSAWIVNGEAPPHPVPEPEDLGMLGLGVMLIGLLAMLSRRRYS